jgi:hypothetical protein
VRSSTHSTNLIVLHHVIKQRFHGLVCEVYICVGG